MDDALEYSSGHGLVAFAPHNSTPPSANSGHSAAAGVGGEVEVVQPARALTAARLAVFVFTFASGGPTGLEGLVSSSGGHFAVIGLSIMPLLLIVPQIVTVSELAGMMPSQGGSVVWVTRGMGTSIGFVYAWIMALQAMADLSGASAIAGMLLTWLLDRDDANRANGNETMSIRLNLNGIDIAFRLVTLLAATTLSLTSIDRISKFIAPIVFMVLTMTFAGFFITVPSFSTDMFSRSDPPPSQQSWPTGLTTLVWVYNGFIAAGTCAGEVKSRGVFLRGFGFALFLQMSTSLCALLVCLAMSTSSQDWQGTVPFVTTAYNRTLDHLGTVFAVLLTALTVLMLTTTIMTYARTFWVISKLGWAPRYLRYQDSETGAPTRAALTLAFCSIPLSLLPLGEIISIMYTIASVGMLTVILTQVRLRFSAPDAARPIMLPGGKIGSVVFAAPQVAVLTTVIVSGVVRDWVTAVVLVSFFGLVGSALVIGRRGAMRLFRRIDRLLHASADDYPAEYGELVPPASAGAPEPISARGESSPLVKSALPQFQSSAALEATASSGLVSSDDALSRSHIHRAFSFGGLGSSERLVAGRPVSTAMALAYLGLLGEDVASPQT
jgi:amino acid transporter